MYLKKNKFAGYGVGVAGDAFPVSQLSEGQTWQHRDTGLVGQEEIKAQVRRKEGFEEKKKERMMRLLSCSSGILQQREDFH